MIESPASVAAALSHAGALFEQGKSQEAAAAATAILASTPHHAAATHLLGLALARLQRAAQAEQLLRRSIGLDPANAQYRVNFANFLRRAGRLAEAERELRDTLRAAPEAPHARHNLVLTLDELGRAEEAEAECRRLLTAADDNAETWSLLGFVLTNRNRLFEAEVAYRRATELRPGYALAHHNLGSVLLQMDRAEQALHALERAQASGVPHFELLFSRGRALTLLYRLEEAEQAFAQAVAMRPAHVEAQVNLARLRFMRSDANFCRSIVDASNAAPDDLQLQALLATVLFRAGKYESAESRIRDVLARHGSSPQFRSLLAQVLLEVGRFKEAEVEALEAAMAQPRDSAIVDILVSVLLSRGRAEDALPFILAQRAREPAVQNWLAHEATAARLLGRPQYQDLFDYERFVRAWRPQPPPGWSSMRDLNTAVAEALAARHRLTSHPLDQSLRNGSQTTRNLVSDPDPAIQALLQSFDEPLQSYLRDIGSDPAHPFTQRNRGGAHLAEGWSVQLGQDGFHVNHIHPKGWISSVYYVTVPAEVTDGSVRSGWLNFGEPRYPVPGATPDRMVQPDAGVLVLFPSYLWHGTNAIHGRDVRTTVAFDAVPAP